MKKIKDYLDKNLIVGIKLYTGHESFYLSDERLKEVYELAQQYDVPVLFHSGWDNCQYSDANVVAAVARQYPNLKLVCCHCFFPRIDKCHLLVNCRKCEICISVKRIIETGGCRKIIKNQMIEGYPLFLWLKLTASFVLSA